MSDSIHHCKADSGTVHKYEGDSRSPQCGAYTVEGLSRNNNQGALRRHEVDPEEVKPWTLCQDCYPDLYKKYPENDHWFNVEPAWKWKGKLGARYTCFVECQCEDCDWIQPASSKREAYSMGYDHKRYPEREQ